MYDIIVTGDQRDENLLRISSPENLMTIIERLYYQYDYETFFNIAHTIAADYFQQHSNEYASYRKLVQQQNMEELPDLLRLFFKISIS